VNLNQPSTPLLASSIATSLALSAAESFASAAASANRAPSFAFSALLVQTLVQTAEVVDASPVPASLTFGDSLIVDLGVAGSNPASHP
jgi:hypothetical protein